MTGENWLPALEKCLVTPGSRYGLSSEAEG